MIDYEIMKMKTLLCCVCLLLGAFDSLKAEEEKIIFRSDQDMKDKQDNRYIQIVPTASHDGRTIYIRLDWPCDRLYVEVEDADGMMVFAGTPDGVGDTEYVLEIPGSGAEEYTLWVLVDETMYVGEFLVGNDN